MLPIDLFSYFFSRDLYLYAFLTLTVLIIKKKKPIIIINRTRVDQFEITIIVKKKY